MRIVHLGKYYAPHRGGIERVVEALCRGLVRRGHDVTVVVSNTTHDDAEELLDGVRVVRMARKAVLRSQPINPGLSRVLSRLSFDVLHVHTPNPLGSLAALRALHGRSVVVTHHSDIVQQQWLLGLAGTLAHGALYARAATLVAATPLHIRYSRLLRRFEDRCRVIPFWVPSAPPSAGPPTSLPPSFSGSPFALFVGRLVHYKGLHVLLDALPSCPGLRLAVVGTGPLGAELQSRAHRNGVEERVAFLGDVTDGELQRLYAACRFLVLPSVERSEAFGLVQLEAMAAGRPVISTNLRSGVPYVNQHERTGLIVPAKNAPALARAMQRLLGEAHFAEELGRAGRARALCDFNEEKLLDTWVTLYAESLGPA